jgi:integrase
MNAVDAANNAEIAMMHAVPLKKFGQLYADIWKVGVNLSLRISDLLTLKYTDLNLEERSLTLTEAKTAKRKTIRLNSAAVLVIVRRRQENPADTWLFQVHSNRAKDKPVSRVSVSRVFKEAGELLGLTINTHSMRKSRGMAMYKDGVPVEKIAKVLNHSNTTSTLRYLGITQAEVLQTYDDYEL